MTERPRYRTARLTTKAQFKAMQSLIQPDGQVFTYVATFSFRPPDRYEIAGGTDLHDVTVQDCLDRLVEKQLLVVEE